MRQGACENFSKVPGYAKGKGEVSTEVKVLKAKFRRKIRLKCCKCVFPGFFHFSKVARNWNYFRVLIQVKIWYSFLLTTLAFLSPFSFSFLPLFLPPFLASFLLRLTISLVTHIHIAKFKEIAGLKPIKGIW